MTLKYRKVFTEHVENNVHVNISSVEYTVYLRHWKGWVYCTVNKSLIAAQSMLDTGPVCFDHTTSYWRNTSNICSGIQVCNDLRDYFTWTSSENREWEFKKWCAQMDRLHYKFCYMPDLLPSSLYSDEVKFET